MSIGDPPIVEKNEINDFGKRFAELFMRMFWREMLPPAALEEKLAKVLFH